SRRCVGPSGGAWSATSTSGDTRERHPRSATGTAGHDTSWTLWSKRRSRAISCCWRGWQAGSPPPPFPARRRLLRAGAVIPEDARPASGRGEHDDAGALPGPARGRGDAGGAPQVLGPARAPARLEPEAPDPEHRAHDGARVARPGRRHERGVQDLDRKSTRLNSSHVATSYAVLRLKKKQT